MGSGEARDGERTNAAPQSPSVKASTSSAETRSASPRCASANVRERISVLANVKRGQ